VRISGGMEVAGFYSVVYIILSSSIFEEKKTLTKPQHLLQLQSVDANNIFEWPYESVDIVNSSLINMPMQRKATRLLIACGASRVCDCSDAERNNIAEGAAALKSENHVYRFIDIDLESQRGSRSGPR